MSFKIEPVRSPLDLEAVRALFKAYEASLGIDLCFQDFDAELASLPGKYAPPSGELLLARDSAGEPVGCVGLRALGTEGGCEMKRLYVSPKGRGLGLGRGLVDAVVDEAKRIGYGEMRLDTLPTMTAAIGLYRASGFETIDAYYETPIADTIFMRRLLV